MIDLDMFKQRLVKAKHIFYIKEISKSVAFQFVKKYHYLGDAKFFSLCNFGLFLKCDDSLIGVATYSAPQVPNSLRGWFCDVSNRDLTILELSRLCVLPELNGTNATSFLLGNSIHLLKHRGVRAVITLADSSRHCGSIYQVCNFKYYGLTPERNIFYSESGKKNPRIINKKYTPGCWVKMPRKHRYAYVLDESLKVLHKEEERPDKMTTENSVCVGCNGTKTVYDSRFDVYYSCPMCTGKLLRKTLSDNVNDDTTENCVDVVDLWE